MSERQSVGGKVAASRSPRVGVGVLAVKHSSSSSSTSSTCSSVLVSLRKSKHGRGEWALPGGHLELGESLVECARRELEEETGVGVEGEEGDEKGRLVATENCVFRSDGSSDAGGAWSPGEENEATDHHPPPEDPSARTTSRCLFGSTSRRQGLAEPQDTEPEKPNPAFEYVEWEELCHKEPLLRRRSTRRCSGR